MDVDTGDLFEEGDGEEGGEEFEPEEVERAILFDLGGQPYAFPVLEVGQVVEPSALTRVPRTAEAIDGVVDLRGEIVAVINPWVHLDVPGEPDDWDDQLLVVFTEREDEQPVGIRVDDILGVESFPESQVEHGVEAGDEGPHAGNPLVEGTIRRESGGEVVERIPLLDAEAVVAASGQHPGQATGSTPGA